MEVIIATALLSVIMVALLEVKTENVFLVNKSQESLKDKAYLSSAINIDTFTEPRNENIYLRDLYSFDSDETRRELKPIKIKLKDEKIDSLSVEKEQTNFNITTYKTTYSIDDKIKRAIYTFKLEL